MDGWFLWDQLVGKYTFCPMDSMGNGISKHVADSIGVLECYKTLENLEDYFLVSCPIRSIQC